MDDALFRPEVREAYQRLVAQGWTDAVRALHLANASSPSGTTSGTPTGVTRASRIDHLFLSPEVTKCLKTAGVDREVRGWIKTSDHAPAWNRTHEHEGTRRTSTAPNACKAKIGPARMAALGRQLPVRLEPDGSEKRTLRDR